MTRTAHIHRMVTDTHTCPFGLKAKALLERKGFAVEDHPLRDRAAVDAFQAEHDVQTTPQVFIDGERIGGYEALKRHLGLRVRDPDKPTYQPIIAVFATTFALAVAGTWATLGTLADPRLPLWFIGFSMAALAMLKLQDLSAFSSQFLGYDLLARRWVRYAYLYPFVEGLAGVTMVAGVLVVPAAIGALTVGSIGAVSVVKAVYIDQRELKCACVGGNSNVPLGFISLTENLVMVGAALWMLGRAFG